MTQLPAVHLQLTHLAPRNQRRRPGCPLLLGLGPELSPRAHAALLSSCPQHSQRVLSPSQLSRPESTALGNTGAAGSNTGKISF